MTTKAAIIGSGNIGSERVHELAGSHSPFLSRPGELAAILRAECADG